MSAADPKAGGRRPTLAELARINAEEELEHRRAMRELELRKARAEAATAERINQVLLEHDRLVDLPDVGGKPS